MAPDATPRFARHHREPTAHELQRLSILVQWLEGNWSLRRNSEEGRAVGLDGNCSEHLFDLPRPVGTHAMLDPRLFLVSEVVGKDTQLLDGSARDPLQAGAGVDVGQEDRTLFAVRRRLVWNHRRAPSGSQRNRLEQCAAFLLLEQHEVVEYVDQIDPPQ